MSRCWPWLTLVFLSLTGTSHVVGQERKSSEIQSRGLRATGLIMPLQKAETLCATIYEKKCGLMRWMISLEIRGIRCQSFSRTFFAAWDTRPLRQNADLRATVLQYEDRSLTLKWFEFSLVSS